MIHDALTGVRPGFTKSFEHAATKFAFRAEGDGAFEQAVTDKFSAEAPILESLEDRKFRAFLKKEQALTSGESLQGPSDKRQQELQKMVAGTLGEGWSVAEFRAFDGHAPQVTKLQLRDGASSQEIYIDRYSRETELKLSSSVFMDGWNVSQSLAAKLVEGALDVGASREDVNFSHQ